MKSQERDGWQMGVGMFEEDIRQASPHAREQTALEEDHRKVTRIAHSVPVRYRIDGKKGEWRQALSVDCSNMGVRLKLLAPLSKKDLILMEVRLPGERRMLRIRGTVVWAHRMEKDSRFIECGVVFTGARRRARSWKLLSYMADKLCQYALQFEDHLVCRPAQSLEELEAAYRLVYKEYLARGYCEPHASQMYYNFFVLLPNACTFVLKDKERVLGTLTLFVDSLCGFPMESLFPEQIVALRKPGRRLAEVGLLALDAEVFGRSRFSLTNFKKQARLFRLFKLMYDHARLVDGVTDFVIAMHPKHEMLYRYLTFEIIGPVRAYPGACGKPALPMHMDIVKGWKEESHDYGKGLYFSANLQPKEALEKRWHLTTDSARRFLMGGASLWGDLTPEVRAHLRGCYPGLEGEMQTNGEEPLGGA